MPLRYLPVRPHHSLNVPSGTNSLALGRWHIDEQMCAAALLNQSRNSSRLDIP